MALLLLLDGAREEHADDVGTVDGDGACLRPPLCDAVEAGYEVIR
jgi:hypothetical protein